MVLSVRETYQLFITYCRPSPQSVVQAGTKLTPRANHVIRKWLQMSEKCSKTKSCFLRSGWCVASDLKAIFIIFMPDLSGDVVACRSWDKIRTSSPPGRLWWWWWCVVTVKQRDKFFKIVLPFIKWMIVPPLSPLPPLPLHCGLWWFWVCTPSFIPGLSLIWLKEI